MKAALLVITMLFSASATAQETILNVASADVLDPKQVYFRLDTTVFRSQTATLAPNFIFGLGHNIEVGMNINAFGVPAAAANRSVVPNIKWKFFSTNADRPNHLDLYVGDQAFFPTFQGAFTAGNYLYGAGAATLHSNTRFTAGAWNASNVVANGNRSGALLGLEQTVAHTGNRNFITLAGDWQSGRGANGALALGVMFFPTARLMVIPSFQLANSGDHNANGAIIFIGYMLNTGHTH
ncbi:MAG TPA: hypothetical protein VN682_20865 [Terriglobales bacterium]|nr:hypothetical protein [Terriglobales bacterium]